MEGIDRHSWQDVRNIGYTVILGTDGDFYVADSNFGDAAIPDWVVKVIVSMRDEFVVARSLVYRSYYECADDHAKWRELLNDVRKVYEFNWNHTSGGRILSWVGNNFSRASGIYHSEKASQSFHERVVKDLEPIIPMALIDDVAMSQTIVRRLEKLKNK